MYGEDLRREMKQLQGDMNCRLSKIELRNFKNTEYGIVEMPSFANKEYFSRNADILGIYGQNGSGKTAVVECISILKNLLEGKTLPANVKNYIAQTSETCQLRIWFTVEFNGEKSLLEYKVELGEISKEQTGIITEELFASEYSGKSFKRKKLIIGYSSKKGKSFVTPDKLYKDLVKLREESSVDMMVARRITQREGVSFIFGDDMNRVFELSKDVLDVYSGVIKALRDYAAYDLFVISNVRESHDHNICLIPVLSGAEDKKEESRKYFVPVDEPFVLEKSKFVFFENILKKMNTVICTIIPGLNIDIHSFGEQLMENGKEGVKVQLVSKRGDVTIPLKYESEGIIKIISLLNLLMCVYNNPFMCLVADELDAGIYEYLLGELLSVFRRGAKGQLLFTSHNLRALEMLDKTSVIFSTVNPENRYIRLKNVRNSNLRDIYLRSIILGGQDEEIYDETDAIEMGRAFRSAGKAVRSEEQN